MKRWLLLVPLCLIACIPVAWAAGALYFDLPASSAVRTSAAIAWVVLAIAIPIFLRPRTHGAIAVAIAFFVIVAWWLSLEPRQDREWAPEYAVLPRADVENERVTLHDVRNFVYRTETDFTPHYETRVCNLRELRGVDMLLCYWGSPWIAHPIASFDFGSHRVCFSVETRRERGEGFSTLGGFYRQFELTYVVADERDLVCLRTEARTGEDVYAYRLNASPERARELFLAYVLRVNELHERPEFYNALFANCTTSVRMQRAPEERVPFDYRILANGKLDELMYERGVLDKSLPFAALKRRAHVNERAHKACGAPDFSTRIRE